MENRIFSQDREFSAPDEWVPLGIWYWRNGLKSLNDEASRRLKKFEDRFCRFDTIPAVTDSHPASQPRYRSKYALCISASRSKKCASLILTLFLSEAISVHGYNQKSVTVICIGFF